MDAFLCPECGWSGDQKVCPNCGEACEELIVSDDGLPKSTLDEDKYPEELLGDKDDLEENEL